MAPEPASLELRGPNELACPSCRILQDGEPATFLRFGDPDSVSPGLGMRKVDGQAPMTPQRHPHGGMGIPTSDIKLLRKKEGPHEGNLFGNRPSGQLLSKRQAQGFRANKIQTREADDAGVLAELPDRTGSAVRQVENMHKLFGTSCYIRRVGAGKVHAVDASIKVRGSREVCDFVTVNPERSLQRVIERRCDHLLPVIASGPGDTVVVEEVPGDTPLIHLPGTTEDFGTEASRCLRQHRSNSTLAHDARQRAGGAEDNQSWGPIYWAGLRPTF